MRRGVSLLEIVWSMRRVMEICRGGEEGVTSIGNSVKSEKSYGVYRGGQGISVQINDSDMVVDNYSPSDLFATGA